MNVSEKKISGILRRFIMVALTAAMAFSLCACSGHGTAAAAPTPAAEPAAAPTPTPEPTPEPTEEPFYGERYVDEDGDGIIQFEFTYKGATVYALAVLDPSRVFVGVAISDPAIQYGTGITLDEMIAKYDAVGGINAGIFLDEGGFGSGWPPYGITYSEGVCYTEEEIGTLAGVNDKNEFWNGYYTADDCRALQIRDAVSFGPVLIMNGEEPAPDSFEKGIGARTAIGQREDGTIILMVADGRQGYSIGLSFDDCARLLYDKFGCINAVNMDGGNSSCIAFNGELLDNPANKSGGTRTLPDAWLIRKLPDGYKVPEGVPTELRFPMYTFTRNMENCVPCDPEMKERLSVFADGFVEAYYGFFGTQNADYYYPLLKQFTAENSELLKRMDLALMDRLWVNSYRNDINNRNLLGAYDNGDGTYTIEYSSDIVEYSNYWTYEHPDTVLRITVYEAPESIYGFLAQTTD